MKISFKKFFGETPEFAGYSRMEREKRFKEKNMCVNCRLMIYNRLSKDDQFCAHFNAPTVYYDVCAYLKPRWPKKLI